MAGMPTFGFGRSSRCTAANLYTFNDQLCGGDAVFMILIYFPPVKEGKDAEFREWFAWSNEKFSNHKGFIRRNLLKPLETGDYAAIVEFENQEAFKAV
jgi:antibiotic biosynthesis monooxygenase (ABM) superfamily enzyme